MINKCVILTLPWLLSVSTKCMIIEWEFYDFSYAREYKHICVYISLAQSIQISLSHDLWSGRSRGLGSHAYRSSLHFFYLSQTYLLEDGLNWLDLFFFKFRGEFENECDFHKTTPSIRKLPQNSRPELVSVSEVPIVTPLRTLKTYHI